MTVPYVFIHCARGSASYWMVIRIVLPRGQRRMSLPIILYPSMQENQKKNESGVMGILVTSLHGRRMTSYDVQSMHKQHHRHKRYYNYYTALNIGT